MTQATVIWDMFPLKQRILGLPLIFAVTVDELADDIADELQQTMQANAPWEDDTGAARDGLGAEAVSNEEGLVFYLFHTVDYGIWLEIRFSGEYAIILPTIESEGPQVMARFDGLFGRMP